jgi:hypothetical protein
MRHAILASLIAALTLLVAGTLAPDPGLAQASRQQPPPAPVKPYKAVAVKPPAPLSDPSFEAFRKSLADIAQRKDRTALAKLVVNQGFFWLQDRDRADKRRPGIDNLAKAIDLDAKDGSGWGMLAGYASDPTGMPLPERRGVICSPADPIFNSNELQAVGRATQTEPGDWGYPPRDGIEVRAAGRADAPVVDKLGMHFVRILPDTAPPSDAGAAQFVRIALPSGKTGFVPADALVPLGGDQMCYVKDATGWKITGYFGGADQ